MVQPRLKRSKTKAFVTFITIVLVSLVTLSITFGALLLSISSVQTSESNEDAAKALSINDACIYDALNKIRLDSNYTGSGSVTLGEGSCNYTVANVSGQVGSDGGGNVVALDFEETAGATTAVDDSGNSHNFLCTGGNCPAFGVAGQCGLAADFDGTNDSLVDDDGENYINGLTAFTLSLWVQSDLTSTGKGFFIAREPNSNDGILAVRYDAAGLFGGGTNVIKSGVSVDTGGGVFVQQMESDSSVQTTAWQHLVITWKSGDDIELYVNGVKDSTPSYLDPAWTGSITDSDIVYIGRGSQDTITDAAGPWNGRIDNFDIWNRVLSAAEVATLFTQCELSTDQRKEIQSTATVNTVTKKVKVTTEQLNPVIRIALWLEVADF